MTTTIEMTKKTRKPRRPATEETKIKISEAFRAKRDCRETLTDDVLIAKAKVFGGSARIAAPREWFDKHIRCIPIDYSPNYDMLDMIIEGPIVRRVTKLGGGFTVIIPQQWRGCMIRCSLVKPGGLK